MSTTQPIIETRHLSKRFGERQAVLDLNLEVPRGSAFGFLGHNGAGKTTLIRMLLGLTSPTAGTMRMSGRPLPQERGQRLDLGQLGHQRPASASRGNRRPVLL